MNLNLVRAIANLSRLGIPVDFNSTKVTITGTSIILYKKGSSIAIRSDKLPELDFEFGIDNFNVELFIQRICQAMTNEATDIQRLIVEGIYNSLDSVGLHLNQMYIENTDKNSSAILIPLGNSVTVAAFYGPVAKGAIKATMVLPLTNDPIRYATIIKSLL